jgi:DNA-binding Lrp family transcriptional regulator
MKAYIFINVKAGKPAAVVQELRRVAGVQSADMCWGLPDIIATAEAADAKALQVMVLDRIGKIADVEQTDTHIVCES